MNKLKKLLVTFLIICMTVPSAAFAADGELFVPDCSREAQVLSAVGVFDAVDGEAFSQAVTRSLAAHYITRLMGLSPSAVSGKFADVTADTPYAAEIEILTDLDIIHGTGAGLFEPDRPMLMQEFVKMLISAIGYSIPANEQGGYPSGYIRYASQLDILDGLEAQGVAENFSVATMAVMLFNALDAEVMTIDEYNNQGSIKLDIVDGSSVLSAFLHIETGAGQVKSTEQGSLTSGESQTDGMVLIDTETYYTGDADILPYLGYKVDFYYKKDGARKTLVYAHPSDDNKAVVIDADDIESYSDMVISYTDDSGKTQTENLSASTDVVYNYRPVAPVTEADIEISNGTVTVIDYDGNGKNDAVIVRSYRTVYARSIDYVGKIIYDEYNTAQPLRLGAAGISLAIYDRKGNKASLDAIEYDSLLSCVISRDGKYMEITEIVDEVIGKVESIETENGNTTYVVIGKKRYGVCPELEAYGLNFDVGDKIICYLDANGDIGMVRDDMVTREKWGYFENVASTNGLDTKTKVRIMADGSNALTVYDCAAKLKVNSAYLSDAAAQKSALELEKGSVVRFALNADGEVSVIKTVSGGGFYEAYKWPGGDDRGLWWDSSINIFGGKIGAAPDTSVFLIPDSGDASKYVCSTVGKSCVHYSYYKLSAYKLDEDKLTADVVTFSIASTKGSSVGSTSPVMMVDAIRADKDEYGDTIYKLAGYVNGNATELAVENYSMINDVPALIWSDNIPVYNDQGVQTGTKRGITNEGSYTVKRGDLIQYQLDSNNAIIDARIILRASDDMNIFGRPVDPTQDPVADKTYNSNDRVMKGWVYQTDGIYFNVSHTKPTPSTVLSAPELYPVISTIGVYVYNETKDTVRVGSMSDFLSYKAVGDGCSEVVAFMTGSDMMAVVLLEEPKN